MFATLKQLVASTPVGRKIQDLRWLSDIGRYKSRLPRQEARTYSDYHSACRLSAPEAADPALQAVRESWENDGFAVVTDPSMEAIARAVDARVLARSADNGIWTGEDVYAGDAYLDFPELHGLFRADAPLSRAIRAAFGSDFKLFYCILYQSRRTSGVRTGSQLWHGDGGPGTCMNLMFALSPLTAENGAMELLPWKKSLEVFSGERAYMRTEAAKRLPHRDAICSYYEKSIDRIGHAAVIQPVGGPGTALMFRNNTIHRGGLPMASDAERRVLVFHVYPSDHPPPLERYARQGLKKTSSYPKNPDFA